MDKDVTDSLARFCVAQRSEFALEDWLAPCGIDPEAIGLAAKYLSMTSWYGHEDELEEVARRKHFCGQSTGLHRESQAINFDLPYFSSLVRFGVARDQQERSNQSCCIS